MACLWNSTRVGSVGDLEELRSVVRSLLPVSASSRALGEVIAFPTPWLQPVAPYAEDPPTHPQLPTLGSYGKMCPVLIHFKSIFIDGIRAGIYSFSFSPSLVCGYPIVPTPVAENSSLCALNCFRIFVKDSKSWLSVWSWTFCLIDLSLCQCAPF